MSTSAQQGRRPRPCFLIIFLTLDPDEGGTQWIVVDAKVYDLSRFANLHPGGAAVLFAKSVGESARLNSGCTELN